MLYIITTKICLHGAFYHSLKKNHNFDEKMFLFYDFFVFLKGFQHLRCELLNNFFISARSICSLDVPRHIKTLCKDQTAPKHLEVAPVKKA